MHLPKHKPSQKNLSPASEKRIVKRKGNKLKAMVEQQSRRLLSIDELPSHRSPDDVEKEITSYRVSFPKQNSPMHKPSIALSRRLIKENKGVTSIGFNKTK